MRPIFVLLYVLIRVRCFTGVTGVSLQHTATHCNTLQHTATHCNTLEWLVSRTSLPQTSRANPVQCYSTHLEKSDWCLVQVTWYLDIRWLPLVASLRLQVSFAKYRLFNRAFLQKRPIILRRQLIVATPYQCICWYMEIHVTWYMWRVSTYV